MLTLVGGANDKYGNNLIAVLENLTRIINDKCHDCKQFNIVIYDLGLSKTYIEQVKQFTNVTIETFDFDKYPEHVSLNKYYGRNCNYSWKPVIIHEVCEKYGGLVHWFDCRTTYTSLNGLTNFIVKMEFIHQFHQGQYKNGLIKTLWNTWMDINIKLDNPALVEFSALIMIYHGAKN